MTKKLSPKKVEALAMEIRELLISHEMWQDVSIYYNGKRLSTEDKTGYYYNDRTHLCIEEDVDVHKYLEYCGDILSISFEGPFYSVINMYGEYGVKLEEKILDEFNEIIGKYGLYYEQGYAWSLSLYCE